MRDIKLYPSQPDKIRFVKFEKKYLQQYPIWIATIIVNSLSNHQKQIHIDWKFLARCLLDIKNPDFGEIKITSNGIWEIMEKLSKGKEHYAIETIQFGSNKNEISTLYRANDGKVYQFSLTFLSLKQEYATLITDVENMRRLMDLFYSNTGKVLSDLKPYILNTNEIANLDIPANTEKLIIYSNISIKERLKNLLKSNPNITIKEHIPFVNIVLPKTVFPNILQTTLETNLLDYIEEIVPSWDTNIFTIKFKNLSHKLILQVSMDNAEMKIGILGLPVSQIILNSELRGMLSQFRYKISSITEFKHVGMPKN